MRVRRPAVPKWVEHFAGWDGNSPGKWDAFQNKCSTSSQIRPRIRSVQLEETGPNVVHHSSIHLPVTVISTSL